MLIREKTPVLELAQLLLYCYSTRMVNEKKLKGCYHLNGRRWVNNFGKNMNTVAKGDQFEDRVYNTIKEELVSERLGLLPNSCRIFRKKKYYSKNRKADIEIDISIEVFLPKAPNWSFLWAIECKDYKGNLPVNDVEEFHAKIQQIAGDNVKATLVVSCALQKSALEYCKSLGIGVARLLPDPQLIKLPETQVIEWVIREPDKSDYDEGIKVKLALTDYQFVSEENFFAFQNSCIYKDWSSLIKATLSEMCINK